MADIALAVVDGASMASGCLLGNEAFSLSLGTPRAGSLIGTWSYTNSTFNFLNGRNIVSLDPSFSYGYLQSYHPNGRDRVMMPFPCYGGTIPSQGGASGGPVADVATGKIFAINCTGFSGTDISYYTSLLCSLPLSVSDVEIMGKYHNEITVAELAELGCVNIS
ncbi:MAG: hypothetical protein U1E38_05640 [Rhodospirillales bacterium]